MRKALSTRRRILWVTLGLATAAVLGTGAVAATEGITTVSARFYSDHAHFGVRYRGYQQPTVDVRVYRTSGPYRRIADHRNIIRRTWHKVYATDAAGFGALAVFNIYYDVDLRARCTSGARLNYVAVFRLFNPATDRAADRYRYSFYVKCS